MVKRVHNNVLIKGSCKGQAFGLFFKKRLALAN